MPHETCSPASPGKRTAQVRPRCPLSRHAAIRRGPLAPRADPRRLAGRGPARRRPATRARRSRRQSSPSGYGTDTCLTQSSPTAYNARVSRTALLPLGSAPSGGGRAGPNRSPPPRAPSGSVPPRAPAGQDADGPGETLEVGHLPPCMRCYSSAGRLTPRRRRRRRRGQQSAMLCAAALAAMAGRHAYLQPLVGHHDLRALLHSHRVNELPPPTPPAAAPH